jgi:hypothetical protein
MSPTVALQDDPLYQSDKVSIRSEEFVTALK